MASEYRRFAVWREAGTVEYEMTQVTFNMTALGVGTVGLAGMLEVGGETSMSL